MEHGHYTSRPTAELIHQSTLGPKPVQLHLVARLDGALYLSGRTDTLGQPRSAWSVGPAATADLGSADCRGANRQHLALCFTSHESICDASNSDV